MITLNKIYNEDYKKFMEKLKYNNMQIDVIMTSPPYNINKDYGDYDCDQARKKFIYLLYR